jgi:hypothetical protein
MSLKRIPVKTLVVLIGILLLLSRVDSVTHEWLKKAGIWLDYPAWFPISIFYGPTIHYTGILYLLIFLAIFFVAYRYSSRLSLLFVFLLGLLLIIFGNLGQGSWDAAFLQPFYKTDHQFYHDALLIDSWPKWLASFNANQQNLFIHTKTHPPFAVLLHYFFLANSGNSLPVLSMAFVLLSSMSIVLLWYILKAFDVPLGKRNLLAILFAVIPAVNIYGAVCLDGVVLTCSLLFFWGVVLILKSKDVPMRGFLLVLIGLISANLLTYGGLFLFAAAGILALGEFILRRKTNLAVVLTFSTVVFIIVCFSLNILFGYNHLQGLQTASAIENPDGLLLIVAPLRYLSTRIEDVSEILLFLSLGFLAMLIHPGMLGFSWSDWRQKLNVRIMLAGIIALVAVLLSGAYKTGETARGALYIYPYLMMALIDTDMETVKTLLPLAALQTCIMQLIAGYFW